MKSKLFSLIVSVLAAMCLWVYVMTVVNPDVDLVIGNIPVTFSGAEVLQEDHGLVITGDYQEFVSVHFYGKNADLKTLDQHKDEIKAVVDVSKVRSTMCNCGALTIPELQEKARLTVVSSTSIVEGGSHDVVLKNATPSIMNG